MMHQPLYDLFRRMRSHFPALDRENSGGYIFFDNAAGAQLPRGAIERVTEHLTRANAQKGTIFARQDRMQETIYALRAGCADLMGTSSERMALGLNASSLTALVAHHLAMDLKPGDVVLTSQMDHCANIWPWEELQARGVIVEMVPITDDGRLDLDALLRLLENGPKLFAFGFVSNATGTVNDVAALARMAHDAGALVFVDCVAGAPHLAMDVAGWDVDFAVCSGYKLFGPHLGWLYVNPARLDDWALGRLISQPVSRYGLGTAYAAKLELGTQNHEGAAGFLGTLEYLESLGATAAAMEFETVPATRRRRFLRAMQAIGQYEQSLTAALLETVSGLPGATVYGRPSVPIVAFNLAGRKTADVCRYLDAHGIEGRSGNYLAIPQMVRLAANFDGEAVRVSLLHYNTHAEIARLGDLLKAL